MRLPPTGIHIRLAVEFQYNGKYRLFAGRRQMDFRWLVRFGNCTVKKTLYKSLNYAMPLCLASGRRNLLFGAWYDH